MYFGYLIAIDNYLNNHRISNHMLVGLISDVHSNIVALKAVLEELDELGVKMILHAGDIVGYNPYPDETIELFRKKKIISILGNHDRAFMTGDTSDFNPYAAAAMEWTRNVASRDSLNYILKLKDTVIIVANGERIVLFHKSPNNFQEYICPEDAKPDILSNLRRHIRAPCFRCNQHLANPFCAHSEIILWSYVVQ